MIIHEYCKYILTLFVVTGVSFKQTIIIV